MRYGKISMVMVTLLLVILWGIQADAAGQGKGKSSRIPAPVPQTGQTQSFYAGDDGALEMGVPLPEPSFTDNGDGTVTDNLTKLVWLKNADRFGLLTWEAALIACNSLQDDDVDLTDGSIPGDWRLSNIKELQSLLDYGYWNPCLSNALGTGKYVDGDPFVGVSLYGGGGGDNNYWSSTSNPEGSGLGLDFVDGQVRIMGKGDYTHYVWPVRNAN